jgi:hypothetical protein
MFSVPLSMAIFAPAERANHSAGTPSSCASSSAAMMRWHSGAASEPSAWLGRQAGRRAFAHRREVAHSGDRE